MDTELLQRIEACNADYELVTGQRFSHFYCPILMRDEPGETCRGHIVTEALGVCNAWVPQRKDVDNFYGAIAEADLVTIMRDREKGSDKIWPDEAVAKRLRPRIECEGEVWPFYFPSKKTNPPDGHSKLRIVGEDGVEICNVVVKIAKEKVSAAEGKALTIVVEKDFRAAVVASVLKAAHLTLFNMLGYKHVFSPTGLYVADILRSFFDKRRAGGNNQQLLDAHFLPQRNMVAPLMSADGEVPKGTLEDRTLLTCFTGKGLTFALGVVVKAGRDAFCVFLPTDCGATIDTYFSFLKELPPSIAVRDTRFCPADEVGEARWEIPPGEPMRMPMNRPVGGD